jgi:hypothetical protein
MLQRNGGEGFAEGAGAINYIIHFSLLEASRIVLRFLGLNLKPRFCTFYTSSKALSKSYKTVQFSLSVLCIKDYFSSPVA